MLILFHVSFLLLPTLPTMQLDRWVMWISEFAIVVEGQFSNSVYSQIVFSNCILMPELMLSHFFSKYIYIRHHQDVKQTDV